jgi:hypothetical protein
MRSLLTDNAVGRTFELFAEAGTARAEAACDGLFAAVAPDAAGALDSAADPHSLPSLDAEPAAMRGTSRACERAERCRPPTASARARQLC